MFKHFAQLFAVVLALLLVASTLGQQQRTQLYSVNCGGSSFTDENGRQWSNDYNFVNKGRKTLYSPRPVQATASMARLYHSQRWCDDCTSEQPMIYTFPVTSNQVYLVNVHFVEFDATLAGNSFTFTVNGQVNEVNILAETGNMSSIAVVKSMNVTVANSALIELSFVKSANHAKVSAIEVFSFEDVSVDQSTPVVQPDPSDSGDDDTDPPSPNPGPNPNPGPGPSPPSSGSSGDGLYGDGTNATPDYVAGYEKAVHRINCGATQDYTDKKGQIWEKDRDFYGATNIDTWTLPFKYIYAFYPEVQQNYVENTFSDEDSVLYTYERWSSGNWGYKLNAPKKGKYLVRLYFAEWYHGNFELFDWNYRTKGLRGIGVRVFSVNVNGATVLPKVDVFQEVGPFAGLRKEFWVDIAQDNGVIDIAFNKIAESPMCNAIEVIAEADVVPRQRLPSGREGGLLIEYYDYNPGRSSKLGAPEQVANPIAIMPNFDNDVTFVSTITYLNTHATIGNFQDTNYLIQFAAKLHGWLRVPEAGKYKITLESNDGSILEICDDDGLSWNAGQCQTIMNDGNHQNIQITQDFEFTKPGFYRVNLRYFQGHLLTCLRLFWMKEEEFSKFEQYYYVGHSIGQDFLSHDKSQASLVMRSVTPAEGSQNGGTTVTINAFMGLSKNKDNVYVREIHPCLPAPGYKQIKANVIDDKTLTFTTQAACFGMGSLQVVVLDSQGNAVKTTNSLQYFFN